MFNIEYIIFMLPALILGLVAQIMVKSRYKKYSAVMSKKGLTGASAAKAVLDGANVTINGIGRIQGELTDHYDPTEDVIKLSDGVYANNSIAAIGVAAHEAGHAVQHAKGYFPMKVRSAIIPVCNFGSRFGLILVIGGFILSYAAEAMIDIANILFLIGIILYSTVALFQLVTLPVEINASRRALKSLESTGVLEKSEIPGAKKVLTAAALTYVAALFSSIMTLLYYASRFKPRQK